MPRNSTKPKMKLKTHRGAAKRFKITANGKVVPLSAVANFRYELEQPTIWRRDRQPTITVKAAVVGPTQPATIGPEWTPIPIRIASRLRRVRS